MKRAVTSLGILKSTILVDGIHSFDKKNKKILTFVKGDQQFPSIAAASILAKVLRDNYMCILAKKIQRVWMGKKLRIRNFRTHGGP